MAARRAEANEMQGQHASMQSGRNIRRSGLKWPVERHCDVLTFISLPNNDQCLFLEKNNGFLFLFFMTGLVGKTGMFLFYFNMCNTHCVLAPGGQKMCRDPEYFIVSLSSSCLKIYCCGAMCR